MTRRLSAFGALGLGLVALVLTTIPVIVDFARGGPALVLLASALASAWHAHVRRGTLRIFGFGAGALLSVVVVALQIAREPALVLGSMTALGVGFVAARHALRVHVALPAAPRPTHPVLFWNSRSGGGKAARFHLCHEARTRGIEPIELTPGKNLEQLVREALDAGADALAMAGGDGSQATVARIAAERGLPFACVPAGTRNHFARDLGVDRNDVVGALDAFVDGGQRVVDLGEVNGRIFVNNVSLGLYGKAVQHPGYRDAKIRTLLETVPEVLRPGEQPDLRWRTADAKEHEGAAAIVVSNNRYRLGNGPGDGTRPRLDDGVLGVAVLGAPGDDVAPQTWTTPSFEVDAHRAVPAGIDGEAVVLHPPLRFRIRPAALHCRIARHHPGASPSAFEPDSAWVAIRTLAGIAAGHEPAVSSARVSCA
jgi:diacylglycerol kinase family enzyme